MVLLSNRKYGLFAPARNEAPSRRGRSAFSPARFLVLLGVVSTIMNLLMLLSVALIIGVFREVMPKHDLHLLAVLITIIAAAYLAYAILQLVRTRVLRGLADACDEAYE